MHFASINPFNSETLFQLHAETPFILQRKLTNSQLTQKEWRKKPLEERLKCISQLGDLLLDKKKDLATLITSEMGKLHSESLSEIEKCAHAAHTTATSFPSWLSSLEQLVQQPAAKVKIEPLGGILGIMPWNFPFWQVIRFSLNPLALGNTLLVKHAPNVPQCALALEELFLKAGFPPSCYTNVFAEIADIEQLIAHPHIRAVSFTGSTSAGRKVAEISGRHGKKTVLELGGSDAFIVMDSANVADTAEKAVFARLINAGQSCVAAKRFFIHRNIYDQFLEKVTQIASQINSGDPSSLQTKLAPLARPDLKNNLKSQIEVGKNMALNNISFPQETHGCFQPITLLEFDRMMEPLQEIEYFGPVFSFFKVQNIEHAVELANDSNFGLGASVWSKDPSELQYATEHLEVGIVALNSMVRSEVNMPFGGTKMSGYGRELGTFGILEFANIKTVFEG